MENREDVSPDPDVADALEAAALTERLLTEALARLGPRHLETIPDDYESWSAVETIGHLVDVEIVYGYRLRRILAEDAPHLSVFDEEAFVITQRWRAADLPTLLSAWSALRRVHLALMGRLSTAELGRGGIHSQDGHLTARDIILKLAVHDRFHLSRLGQLEEKLLRPLA